MIIPTFTSVEEARAFLAFQIWFVIGFVSQMQSGEAFSVSLLKSVFCMALGPLNVIRILINNIIHKGEINRRNKTCHTANTETEGSRMPSKFI